MLRTEASHCLPGFLKTTERTHDILSYKAGAPGSSDFIGWQKDHSAKRCAASCRRTFRHRVWRLAQSPPAREIASSDDRPRGRLFESQGGLGARNATVCLHTEKNSAFSFAAERTAKPDARELPFPSRSRLHARDLGAGERQVRHQAGIGQHKSHHRRIDGVDVDGPVRAGFQDGDRGIRADRPAG